MTRLRQSPDANGFSRATERIPRRIHVGRRPAGFVWERLSFPANGARGDETNEDRTRKRFSERRFLLSPRKRRSSMLKTVSISGHVWK